MGQLSAPAGEEMRSTKAATHPDITSTFGFVLIKTPLSKPSGRTSTFVFAPLNRYVSVYSPDERHTVDLE